MVGSAAWIGLALVLAGFAISSMFSTHLERTLQADLETQLNRLVALIEPADKQPRPTQPLADPRFSLPLGGLYWQVSDPVSHAIAKSRSLWDTTLSFDKPGLTDGAFHTIHFTGPKGVPALALVRRLTFDTEPGQKRTLDLTVAEDLTGLQKASASFRAELTRDLVVLAVILVLAAWMQVTLGLRPLASIRRGLEAIRTGRNRKLEGAFPIEVMPLVMEVNQLLATQEKSITFARDRAADLAHGLKTGLTVLTAEAESLRRQGNTASAQAIDQLAEDMAVTIDHQLSLSRLRLRSRVDHYATHLSQRAHKVVATLKKTPRGRDLVWTTDIDPDLIVDLDTPDLTELLGIVVENAAKYARTGVKVTARRAGGIARLDVEEDGPGLAPEQMSGLGVRGVRLDQRKPGSGLGLSIAREIADINQGEISFAASPLGGLKVTLTLPLAAAAAQEPEDIAAE